jgi:hypothetical protein
LPFEGQLYKIRGGPARHGGGNNGKEAHSTIRNCERTQRLRDLKMAEKTIVEKAAEAVGYGIAMAEDVAGSVKTAVGAAVTTVTGVLTKTPAKKVAAKKTVAKEAAQKASPKKAAKKAVTKKAPKRRLLRRWLKKLQLKRRRLRKPRRKPSRRVGRRLADGGNYREEFLSLSTTTATAEAKGSRCTKLVA